MHRSPPQLRAVAASNRGGSFPSRYDIGRKLGSGAYGDVYEAHLHGKATKLVMKVYAYNENNEEAVCDAYRREVTMLKQLVDAPQVNAPLFICAYGRTIVMTDVGDNIRQRRCEDPLEMHAHIGAALRHLHSKNILHLDVKPENITFDGTNYSLVDYGSVVVDGQHDDMFYRCTRWYRSPELIFGVAIREAADWWALACCLAEAQTGLPLFPGRWEEEVVEKMVAELGAIPEHLKMGSMAYKADMVVTAGTIGTPTVSVTVKFDDGKRSYLVAFCARVHQLRALLESDPQNNCGPRYRLLNGDLVLKDNDVLTRTHYDLVCTPTQVDALPNEVRGAVLEGLGQTWNKL